MKTRSLKKMMFKAFACVVIVGIIALGLIQVGFNKHVVENNMNAMASAYSSSIENAVYVDLAEHNYLRLYQVASRFYNSKLTRSITILDSQQNIIAAIPDYSAALFQMDNIRSNESILHIRNPIMLQKDITSVTNYSNITIGYLDVVYFKQYFIGASNELFMWMKIAFSLVVIMLMFVGFIFYGTVVNKYMNIISKINVHFRNKTPFSIEEVGRYVDFYDALDATNTLLSDIFTATELQRRNTSLISLGQSTAMVAHDVRKPLTGMKALLSALPTIKDDPKQLKKMIANVDSSISQTNTLLNDILEFSRDSTSLNLSEADPQVVIISALSDAFRNCKGSGVKINYDLNHTHVLHVDSSRIIRVLINIMDNALDAMELNHDDKSVGLLQISTNEVEKEEKRFITISVADNGPGLSEDVLTRVFDPFFTQGKSGGTGLGLAICHRIITMHDGKIEATNRPNGGGALFTIELQAGEKLVNINKTELIYDSSELKPFREEEAARIDYGDTANTAEFMRLNKEKGRLSYLLIVDDEPLFRESIRCLLGDLGQVKDHVKVVEVDSAEKALTLFKSQKFDYVIADIDLGKRKMNGYEFARVILDSYPNTHVLIHSNKRKDEMDKNIRKIESPLFLGFLPKPMRSGELLQFLACKSFESIYPTPTLPLQKGGRRKVLIVNDDDCARVGLKFELKNTCNNVQVLEASNVSDALNLFTKNSVDIVISDLNLGDDQPNGYEFLRTVRETNKDIPFYIASGYSEGEEAPKAKSFGATGYLQLPFEADELKKMLDL